MRHEVTVHIAAGPAAVWAVLADVEHWPDWTPTMRRITALDEGPLAEGARYRVEQPRSRPSVWRVEQCAPGASFVWATRVAGTRMVAGHWIEPDDDGCRVRLTLTHTGPLAGVLDLLVGRMLVSYVETEAASLRKHCAAA